MDETRHVRARAVIAALAIVAFLCLAAAAGTYELELWGGKTVPSVKGLSEAHAVQQIEAKGLQVQVEEQPSDSGIGYVLSCDPGEGSRVQDGGTVKLVVSANRTVPDLEGQSLDAARKALADEGAQNVKVTYDSSRSEAEGTVLSVSPAAGTVITTGDEVDLVVAQAPVVPDVVGKSEDEALKALDAVSLTANVSYVQRDGQKKGTVLSSSPAAGKTAGDDGVVTLSVVNPYPTDVNHLLEYFSSEAGKLPQWLENQGFELKVGYKSADNHAVEQLAADDGTTVTFTPTPWASKVSQQEGSDPADVISAGAFYDGLRLELPEDKSPDTGATEASVQTVIDAGGFGDATDSCTQADVTTPDGTSSPRANFCCASGESGSYDWAVLVEATSESRTRVTCVAAPKELVQKQDLSQFGNSLCDFVAYQELYGKK